MFESGNKTMHRLKPGAAWMKRTLNASRKPRKPTIVHTSNFFPGSTNRPTINVGPSVTPTEVSPQSFFPGPKSPSPFNLDPRDLHLHNKQTKAVANSEKTGVLAFPMNYSSGGITPRTGGKSRKNRSNRKHSKRKHSNRKHSKRKHSNRKHSKRM